MIPEDEVHEVLDVDLPSLVREFRSVERECEAAEDELVRSDKAWMVSEDGWGEAENAAAERLEALQNQLDLLRTRLQRVHGGLGILVGHCAPLRSPALDDARAKLAEAVRAIRLASADFIETRDGDTSAEAFYENHARRLAALERGSAARRNLQEAADAAMRALVDALRREEA